MASFGSSGAFSIAVINSNIDNWQDNEDRAHSITTYLEEKKNVKEKSLFVE